MACPSCAITSFFSGSIAKPQTGKRGASDAAQAANFHAFSLVNTLEFLDSYTTVDYSLVSRPCLVMRLGVCLMPTSRFVTEQNMRVSFPGRAHAGDPGSRQGELVHSTLELWQAGQTVLEHRGELPNWEASLRAQHRPSSHRQHYARGAGTGGFSMRRRVVAQHDCSSCPPQALHSNEEGRPKVRRRFD